MTSTFNKLGAAAALALVAGACTNPRAYPLTRATDADDPGTLTADAGASRPGDAAAAPADAPLVPDTNLPLPGRDSGPPSTVPADAAAPCAAGTHRCAQGCLRDDSVDSCGQRCDPCARPSPGSVACVQGQCQLSCPSGYHNCFGLRCGSDTAVESCGFNCDPCPDVENGDATCDGRICGTRCRAGLLVCTRAIAGNERTSACVRPTLDFESGTLEGFRLVSGIGVDAPVIATKMAHSGSYALAQAVRARAEADNTAYLCRGGGGSLNARGKRLTLWYYFDRADPPPGARILLSLAGAGNGVTWSSGAGDWPLIGQRWTKISSEPIDYEQSPWTTEVGFGLNATQAPSGYTATLYVDDVALE